MRWGKRVVAPATGGIDLRVVGLCAGYGHEVLHAVDLEVAAGEVVAMLGANGAGKSTLAASLIGVVQPTAGRILVDGDNIAGLPATAICERGLAIVPEGRRVFAHRTIEVNLQVAAWPRRHDPAGVRADIAELLDRYPILARRRRSLAGSLSGGEAQMLAIAMALVARPRLVIFDEPSLGLAPIAVGAVADQVAELRDAGTSVLLIEQNAQMALGVADRGYVLELGRLVASGTSKALRDNDEVRNAYLRM